MRTLLITALSIPVSLVACATDEPSTDELSAELSTSTKITIKTDGPQALVAYRDFSDPVWHAANAKSPTKYVAKVHGPYLVTAVCVTAFEVGGTVFGKIVNVLEYARTLDDATELTANTCNTVPKTREVTGLMAQIGSVLVGDSLATSISPDWTFQLPVRKGTYTLYASTPFDGLIVIRRGLDVQHDVTVAPIDAAVEGHLLDSASFTVTNASMFDTEAIVAIQAQSGTVPLTVSKGSLEFSPVIPNDVLTPDDNQTVTVQARTKDFFPELERTTLRASRRPWRIGDDPAFTLPDLFGAPSWALNSDGDNAVSWSSQPAFSVFTAQEYGNGQDASFTITSTIDASPSFIAASSLHSLTFDTQIPGFQPEWRINHDIYIRSLSSRLFSDPAAPDHGTVDTSYLSDFVSPR